MRSCCERVYNSGLEVKSREFGNLLATALADNLMRKSLFILLLTLLISCSEERLAAPALPQDPAAMAAEHNARFVSWLDTEFAQELDFSPLAKTRLGDRSDYDQLDDVSEAALEQRMQWRRDSVTRMRAEFDRELLDEQGQLSWDLWDYYLQDAERLHEFSRHAFIFGRNGPQAELPADLINYHEVNSLADMQAYISRLRQSNRYMLQYLERARLAVAADIRAPYFDYQRAISEIERLLSGAPFTEEGASALWTDSEAKIAGLLRTETITAEQAEALREQVRDALLTSFKPAYDEVLAWLQTDFANVPTEAEGAWMMPNGMHYYHALLQSMTTLPLTAGEIHDTGLAEVARIQAEMLLIKDRVGYGGSLQEFFSFLRDDDQFYLPNTDQGRAEYLAIAEDIVADVRLKLPEFFGRLPKAPLEIRRVEAFREVDGGAAFYARGTPDGSRPGTFYQHLSDMRASPLYRLENLVYHEGLPGHHLQISLQQEMENLPKFRNVRGFTVYSEGWGLYAEHLGKEMGFYRDTYAEMGHLSGEIWRAVRLVVDTGIHALYWSQEDAVQYALENSPRPEASVRSEIHRYYNNPAQAVAYKIGELKIREIRARAEAALGDKFDIRAFHDTLLGSGPLPLLILETRIDSWVESLR